MLQRYPHLAQVPDVAPNGIDTPLPPPPSIIWDDLGSVVPIDVSDPDVPENDDSKPDEVVHTTWHDVALSIAAELMGKVREDIRVKFGYTTSAVGSTLFPPLGFPLNVVLF